MDLLEELQLKLAGLSGYSATEGIKAAVHHIEVAERHLARGRAEDDVDYYNDVIYRTNQAFEGMLKEAYTVLADTDGNKRSPNDIEQYFLKEKKLAARVMTLFRNYRQEWRNPSTHDHRLVFRDDESLLAIVSVSAFAVVLLDQIVETISFHRQRDETTKKREHLVRELGSQTDRPFAEEIANMLRSFGDAHDTSHDIRTEAELVGRLSGFLVGLIPDLKVTTEAQLGEGLRSDLLIRRGGESVVVEVKRGARSPRLVDSGLAQMKHYLSASKMASGILYVAPYDNTLRVDVEQLAGDGGQTIWIVAPRALVGIAARAADQGGGADGGNARS